MAWFRRNAPEDTSALFGALTHGSLEDVLAVYRPAYVDYDGAYVRKAHPVHALLGQNTHDFSTEPALLERMLDLGADVNRVMPRFGTPLETIATSFQYIDIILAPVYDVPLARTDLDLLQPGLDGRPVLVNLRKW